MGQQENRVNWVRERGNCNVNTAFRELTEIVEQDVQTMNELLQENCKGYRYEFLPATSSSLSLEMVQVRRAKGEAKVGIEEPTVTFSKKRNGLRIARPKANELLVTCEWCESEVACRFFLDNKTVALWEVSRKALEPLFFEDEDF